MFVCFLQYLSIVSIFQLPMIWSWHISIKIQILYLQESSVHTDFLLLHNRGFYILLGPQSFTYKMVVQACPQCSSRVSDNTMMICDLLYYVMLPAGLIKGSWYSGMQHPLDWILNMLIQLKYCFSVLLLLLVLPSLDPIWSLCGCGW